MSRLDLVVAFVAGLAVALLITTLLDQLERDEASKEGSAP